MNREQIQQEIDNYNSAINEMTKNIAELKKQLAEPEIFPCRWCGNTPTINRDSPTFKRDILVMAHKSDCKACDTIENQIKYWNEMNDTREARIVEKDGNRFAEFTIRAHLHPKDRGLIYVHAEAIRFHEGGYLPLSRESQTLKIEVK